MSILEFMIVPFFFYFELSTIYFLMDVNPIFCLLRYDQEVTIHDYVKCLPVLVKNIVVSWLFIWGTFSIWHPGEFDPWWLTTLKLVICILIYQALFYTLHRAMHRYVFVLHQQHHEFDNPIAFAALYSGTVDHILTNIIPFISAVILTRISTVGGFLFFMMGILSAILSHSGYPTPWNANTFHLLHHKLRNVNFGSGYWMDFLCDTLSKEMVL
jgi:sterol desaturase/sphingolipid hydroxylase (fatty acid hydroxylase superfamily)